MSTVHNSAKIGDIAKNVIMPGDPLRAKFIAETFLTDVKQVNSVRNMFAYTGKYKNQLITVMGHGMGMPSVCIYAHELYNVYGVQNIIRVGSCGGIVGGLKLFDTIIVKNAHTDSNIGKKLGIKHNSLPSSEMLFNKAIKVCDVENDKSVKIGDIYTSDVFYSINNKGNIKFAKKGALGVEMESFGLFAEAKRANKGALAVITVSDIVGSKEATTPEQREKSFTKMITIALDTLTE